jgi:hypothetical protein
MRGEGDTVQYEKYRVARQRTPRTIAGEKRTPRTIAGEKGSRARRENQFRLVRR